MKRLIGGLTAAAFVVAFAGPVAAQDARRVKFGTLSCDVSAGIGLIIGSQKHVQCIFTPSRPGPREVYGGTIGKFGLDLSVTAGGQMVRAVFAPTTRRLGRRLAAIAAPAPRRRWALAPASMFWSAAPTAPSRCSRFRFRDRSASISRPASPV